MREITQSLNPQISPHIPPSQPGYRVYIVNILEKLYSITSFPLDITYVILRSVWHSIEYL